MIFGYYASYVKASDFPYLHLLSAVIQTLSPHMVGLVSEVGSCLIEALLIRYINSFLKLRYLNQYSPGKKIESPLFLRYVSLNISKAYFTC